MSRPQPSLVIDARPRGPDGPLAVHRLEGRPVLAHLVELAAPLGEGPIAIHARVDEHPRLRSVLGDEPAESVQFVTGPPPEGSAILRTDRLYDPRRLQSALRRGRDPESAAIWRLDAPFGLAGAEEELVRRRTYQPLGRFWALGPARLLARLLRKTAVRPNHVTLASFGLVLSAAATVAWAGPSLDARLAGAIALALGLVLDTADGHLARLQGTASAFGRWLDAHLDELGDMLLHAAVAWSAYVRDQHVGWLLAGMLYGMGKHVFLSGSVNAESSTPKTGPGERFRALAKPPDRARWRFVVAAGRLLGHADVRWHLWIVLAAVGRLDMELVAFAAYYPARALAGALRKAGRHG